MAGNAGNQFNPPSYLTPNQQDLLMAALASNNPNRKPSPSMANADGGWDLGSQFGAGGADPLLYTPGQQNLAISNFNNLDDSLNDSPFADLLDSTDANLDFDMSETADMMIGSLPNANDNDDDIENDEENREKRKSPDRDTDDRDETNTKRRDPDEKVAKKPGRKPLTSEPTNKRKAQNRAAQRAFRERKEKHLRDLETEVIDLKKASEAANHENGLLRAKVDRLQMELREYRKRLSSSNLGRSSPLSNGLSSYLATSTGTAASFQFEFPRFGSLPGGVFSDASLRKPTSPTAVNGAPSPASNPVPGVLARHDSNGQVASPQSQGRGHGSNSSAGSPTKKGSISSVNGFQQRGGSVQVESINNDGLAGLFSTPMIQGAADRSDPNLNPQSDSTTPSDAANPQRRIFHFNSNTTSSGSPTASSVSQHGGNSSSCGTSPEPSHNSPTNGNKDGTLDMVNENGYTCAGGSDGEVSFCEKLNMACGNPQNPVPRAMPASNPSSTPVPALAQNNASPAGNSVANATAVSGTPFKGIDWLAQQNGGQFDPMLFGDYRDSQAAIVGDGDFTGGFFNDAMPLTDFTSPFSWDMGAAGTGLSPSPAVQRSNPLEQADLLQAGADEAEVVPADDMSKMLGCHNIWQAPFQSFSKPSDANANSFRRDKLQDNAEFKSGSLDIDGLCSELRAKARCSETGVLIDQKHVDAALNRLPPKPSPSGISPTR